MSTQSSFEQLKQTFKIQYSRIEIIKNPALNQNVYFNAKGLQHLFYKGNRSPRNLKILKDVLNVFHRQLKLLTKQIIFLVIKY